MSARAGRAASSSESQRPRGRWPHQLSHEPIMRVSDVLAALQVEFPALSASKLRYLDAESVVSPSRTGAGYRHYSPADVERLRLVLAMQRDQYAPLTVIQEQLRALDAGEEARAVAPRLAPDANSAWVSRREPCAYADVDDAVLELLIEWGVVDEPRPGRFPRAAIPLVHAAGQYLAAGADPRELRALDRAAARERDAAESAARPAHAKGDSERAAEQARARTEAAAAYFLQAIRRRD